MAATYNGDAGVNAAGCWENIQSGKMAEWLRVLDAEAVDGWAEKILGSATPKFFSSPTMRHEISPWLPIVTCVEGIPNTSKAKVK
jgi:hypothetical protein